MSALIALKMLVGVTALVWVGMAAVHAVARCGIRGVPELFLASAASGAAAVFLDAAQ